MHSVKENNSKNHQQPSTGPLITANYTKFAENVRRFTPPGFQCSIFCGGVNCKYENPTTWTENETAIQGLYSHWITNEVLATARPSTNALIKHNIIQQFQVLGIKSVVNLQTPREHASCGPPLEDSGFSYDPTIFMKNDIFFYNFAWKDYGDATLGCLLNMVKVVAFAVEVGRVAIHCHAGLGRTGVLAACYLIYALRIKANDAIRYVRMKRPGSVQTAGQVLCVQQFGQFILPQTVIYVFGNSSEEKKPPEVTIKRTLQRQKITLHGYEERALRKLPKIIYCICERILKLCGCWQNEYPITNVPFTEKFLVAEFPCNHLPNYTGRDSVDSISYDHDRLTENATLPSCSSSYMIQDRSAQFREHNDNLSDSSEDDENVDNKTMLWSLHCDNEIQDNENVIYEVKDVCRALLQDGTNSTEEIETYIREFENAFNSSLMIWSKLDNETNLIVLTRLLYDWLECLKIPVLNIDDLAEIVVHYKQPMECLKKFNQDHQYVLEYILRFLVRLQPVSTSLRRKVIKRMAASLTKQAISVNGITMPAGKSFPKLRKGTLSCLIHFMNSFYNILNNLRQRSAISQLSVSDISELNGSKCLHQFSEVSIPDYPDLP